MIFKREVPEITANVQAAHGHEWRYVHTVCDREAAKCLGGGPDTVHVYHNGKTEFNDVKYCHVLGEQVLRPF